MRMLLGMIFSLCLARGLSAEACQAVVEVFHGAATVCHPLQDGSFSPPQALSIGQQLATGDKVETGADSSALLLLDDDTKLEAAQNSILILKKMEEDGNSRTTLLSLAQGLLNAVVSKLNPGDRFELETPQAVAAVKGTEYDAEVGPDKTEVSVTGGTVWLGDHEGQATTIIRPGMQAASLGGRLGEARAWAKGARQARRARWMKLRQERRQYIQSHPALRAARARWQQRRENWRREALKRRAARRGAIRGRGDKKPGESAGEQKGNWKERIENRRKRRFEE